MILQRIDNIMFRNDELFILEGIVMEKHWIDDLLQRLYHNSDDDLLKEIKAAEDEMETEGGPQPDSEGFERLWKKLIDEHEKGGARG